MSLKRNLMSGGARLHVRGAGSGSPDNTTDMRSLLQGIQQAFSEFRQQNDQRLQQLEQRGTSDVVTEEHVQRIDGEIQRLSDALTEMSARSGRPGRPGGSSGQDPVQVEYRTAWDRWARRGEREHELRDIERRANTTQTGEDGGYLVPDTVDRNILDILGDQSDVRSLFTAMTVGADSYKRLVGLHGTSAGWVGETDARSATNGPQFTEVEATFGEMYANPQISQRLLDDSAVDLEAYIGNELAIAFAENEAQAYLFGDGVKKPKGLFSQPTSADGDKTRTFGTYQLLTSTKAGGLGTNADASDKLLDMIYATKSTLRQGATWLMNSTTVSAVRKLKDGQGNYLWQPSSQIGEPATLLGYGVNDMEIMPDIAASAIPIAFGNFKRAYMIVDRIGIRTLRDPYTNKPFVGFYATKRTGGISLDSRAVKFLQIASP